MKIDYGNYPLTQSMFTNGKALLDANHIQDIWETRKPGCLPEITGVSVPQVSIREPVYKIFMQLDENRKIIKLECQCRQGESGM